MNYQGNKHVSGAESRKIRKRKDGEDKVLSDGMSQWLKKPKKTDTETDAVGQESSELFEIRPWSKLLLNEGSFIRAYATYEYWLRQPPSVGPVSLYSPIIF